MRASFSVLQVEYIATLSLKGTFLVMDSPSLCQVFYCTYSVIVGGAV